ncbi:MAG: hypothetical protein MI867_15045, partial [Pseudomonadales bacterium]|nr:hypothetical protein [Pseudomonadales bacterium]
SDKFTQIDVLLEAVQQLFEKSEYAHIFQRTLFVQYDSENTKLTESFSQVSQARVIWGGDETVRKVKQIQSHPRSVDIAFANRHSISLINPFEILDLANAELTSLVERFYQDTFVMNQRACSSPKIVVWTESEYLAEAQTKFWSALEQHIDSQFNQSESETVAKYTQLLKILALYPELSCNRSSGQKLYRITAPSIHSALFNLKHDNGTFIETISQDLNAIFEQTDRGLQTVTYFGIDPQEILAAVANSHCLGVDRIVPFGQALEFDVVWDGVNLINALSRIITIN